MDYMVFINQNPQIVMFAVGALAIYFLFLRKKKPDHTYPNNFNH